MMAALVQSFPQQPSSTVTILRTRPTSSSGPFQTNNQAQQQRGSQMTRNVYGGGAGGGNNAHYRGQSSPVAPYAFTTTPSFASNGNPLRQNPTGPHLRQENRTLSAPVNPVSQLPTSPANQSRQRQLAASPTLVDSTEPISRDDSSVQLSRLSVSQMPALDLTLSDPRLTGGNAAIAASAAKPSPDRYRRNHRKSDTSSAALGSGTGSAMPSGSGMATVGHLYNHPSQSLSSPAFSQSMAPKPVSKDDSAISRQSADPAKRYRRRSIGTMGNDDLINFAPEPRPTPGPSQPRTYASVASTPYNPQKQESRPVHTNLRPGAFRQNASDESISSSRSASRPSSSKREGSNLAPGQGQNVMQGTTVAKKEAKLVNIPPRASSEAGKRMANPSPLSKPVANSPDTPVSQNSFAKLVQSKNLNEQLQQPAAAAPRVSESPAAQHLAALNKKEGKKESKSRLRRAFSFGSAAELRKASAENNHDTRQATERAKLRKDRYNDEQEAREAAIVQQQEASGLGEGIYSGQGHFFTGSTDNLSISSTASSASVMLRKMGKGVKKSTRSLVGLFRPKSVIGVPSADAAVPEPSLAQISMVTVEAEREKVNVNVDPHDQVGGGTGFPKLERNSIDAASLGTSEPSLSFSDRSSDNVKPRQSIVGGEKERAEVLAAVKKGILKRSGTDSGNSSPRNRPADSKSPDFDLPQVPRFNDSPHSSAPSTPVDDHTPRGHQRNESVSIEGEDYFMSVAKFAASDSKSFPGTPRNISFSPRIQFHDTWPSGEYDRRGEIATCNRLTPTLAQAIKEELNTFKMEMEVHESSKVYTHFF